MAIDQNTRTVHAPFPAVRYIADRAHALGALFAAAPASTEQSRVAHLLVLTAIMLAGAAVRLWGLGAVGLHGDEETMALAVRHILIDGRPILPSGMFYPRGMTQLYLMAASAASFGESEWALRLPSVVCGVALIGLAYLAGRRFLQPTWNLAFVATVAFLPQLIIDSQTARMYIFLVTAIMAALTCVFAWERTGRLRWLIAAVVALVFGLDFHALAIGSVLMFLFPGLVHGDGRRLGQGALAIVAVGVAFVVVDFAVGAQYPTPPADFAADLPPGQPGPQLALEFSTTMVLAAVLAGALMAVCAAIAVRRIDAAWPRWSAALLLVLGALLQLMLFYHLAAIVYVAAFVLALRYGERAVRLPLLGLGVLIACVAGAHVMLAATNSDASFARIVGALIGWPSVWPYVRLAELSTVAALLTAVSVAWGLVALALRRRASEDALLAVLTVWAPVFALGVFAWNVPARYTEMSIAPMLLCAAACAQRLAALIATGRPAAARVKSAVLALAASACIVNPAAAASVVGAGYSIHPDHKGAADFIRDTTRAGDIVLAEDVLQQSYYLGRVDYWLIGKRQGRQFVKRAGDGVVDFYTATPLVSTAPMLDELLRTNADKRIFIIGSGEQQSDGREFARGSELHRLLESDRFEVVFVGRDGLTKVLRARHNPNSGASDASDAPAKSSRRSAATAY